MLIIEPDPELPEDLIKKGKENLLKDGDVVLRKKIYVMLWGEVKEEDQDFMVYKEIWIDFLLLFFHR